MDRLTKRMTSCWIRTKSGRDYTNYSKDWDCISLLAEYEDLGVPIQEIRRLLDKAKTDKDRIEE